MTRIALLTVAVLAATGCQSGFFSERGTMASDGPYPNTWKWHPQGCTRDPFDGLPVGQSKSIVTLLWANPGLRDPSLSIPSKSPDAPLRLEFMPVPGQAPGAVVGTLHTIDKGGILLDKSDCSKLELKTRENPPLPPDSRPSLSGQLELDCHANQSHITASVQFEHCQY